MINDDSAVVQSKNDEKLETATIASGCFWCSEAIFSRVKGVESVTSGYSGGKIDNPSYEQVCTGTTGHAEAVQIKFNPKIITFEKILDIFWHTHDPTTMNRQGNDIGTQYRSAIFYHDEGQKSIAEKLKKDLEKEHIFKDPIVTEIIPFSSFYAAEKYHKDYYENNRNVPYCNFVIDPKIEKLLRKYNDKIKREYL
ncbi:MAG TPA: peptide-methionine (S)-S-oxide reductase MsrA [Nitrososphaeraceae archaeon]|jgi:peptide-methionine (S)-S-oxide reductase